MVAINPDVQQVGEPSFLNYFKPTSAPAVNTKAEIALKGVGQFTEGALKTADTLVDKMATDEATKKAEELRNQQVASQSAVLDLLKNPDARAEDEGPMPQNIKSVAQEAGEQAAKFSSAKANGKMSKTQYLGEIDAMQSDLHSRYPQHYHAAIDRAVAKATGFDVANDLVNSQLADINSYIGRKDADHDKLSTKLNASLMFGGGPDANFVSQNDEMHPNLPNNRQWVDLVNKWHAGGEGAPSDNTMRSLLGEFEYQDYKTKKESNDIELASKQGQNVSERANQAGSAVIMHSVTNQQKMLDAHTNYDADEAKQWISDVMSGKKQPDDALGIHYAQTFRLAKQQVSAGIDAALKADPAYKYMDPTKLKAAKDAALSYYDSMASFFEDKEHGLAFYAANLNKATSETFYRELTTNKSIPDDLRTALLTAKALNGSAPEFVTGVLNKVILGNKSATDTLASTVVRDIMNQVTAKPKTSGPPPAATGGLPPASDIKPEDTPGGLADKYRKVDAPPEVQKHIVDMVPNAILSKDLPDVNKVEQIRRAFDPANKDFLTKYEEDHVDPSGRIKPGQYAVLQHWGSPEMAKEVKRLSSGIGGRYLWDQYKNWIHTEGFNLFDRDFNSLGEFEKFPGRKVLFDTDNPDNPHFRLSDRSDRSITSPEEFAAQGKIANINKYIGVIRNMQKAEGSTPEQINAYLIQTMRNAGYDYNKIAVDRTDNIPSDMVKAVIAGSRAPEPATTTKSGSQKKTPSVKKKKNE